MSVCRPGWVVGVSRWVVNVEVLAWDGLGGWDFADVETSSAVVMEGRQHDAGGGAGFCSRREDRDLCSEFVALLMHPAESCAESTITATAQGCQRPAPAHPAARLRCPSVNPISVLARRDWSAE